MLLNSTKMKKWLNNFDTEKVRVHRTTPARRSRTVQWHSGAVFYRQVFSSPLQSQPNLQTYKPLKHPSSRDSYQRIRFSCCVASLFRIYLEPSDADLMMRENANDFLISVQHLIAFKKRVHILEKKRE
jgi:hypothetical protein